jgi:hypothetical protein
MLYAVSHRGLSAKDLRFISNRAGHGIFYIFRGAFSSISDITIVGGVGHAILFAPTTNDTLAHWRFDNWRIYGGLNVPPDASGSTARYKSVIAISEHLDTLQGSLRDITFSNFVVDTTEANTCLVSVDIGDDNTLAGANTALEDDLAQVSILNSSLRVPTAGAIVCLGNDESASPFYDASNSAGVLQHSSASQAWAATRYLPRLEGNSINGVPMADQKQRAVAAAQVPDGDGLPPGITVLINDDTAENDCTDATANGTLDGGGTAVSACIWNGTTWVGL